MPTPFAFQGTLQLPPDSSLPQDPIGFGMSAQFTSKAEYILQLTGSGTKTLDLGTLGSPGAKGYLIKVEATPSVGALPITVRLNGAGAPGEEEIAPGGFKAVGNPSPVSGVTQITIVWQSDCRVSIWVLG